MEDKYFEIDSDEKIEDLTLFNNETASFKENFILMMKNAIPAYLSIIFDGITTSLSIAFVGGLNDPIQLAAVGISETLTLLLYYYPVLTNLGAFDTLVSTSYGNKQYRLCGDYLNRALLIMTLFSILPIIGLLFIKDIMTFLEQDPAVVEIAQVYFYYRIPTLFVILYESILKRYLEAMGFFNFLSYSAFIQLFVHIICLFVFMYVFEMNYLGVAISIGVSSCVGLAMVFVYFKMISKSQLPEGCIHWFNSNSFRGWWQFIKLSVPSTFMSIIEGGTFEAMTILAGLFGINELSSNTILNDLSMKIYISGIGISIASTALVGKNLGESKFKNSEILTKCTIALGVTTGLIIDFIILFFHYFVFRFYTRSDEIIEILDSFVFIILIQTFLDHIQGPLKGVFRALGRQNQASYILMFSYCVVGSISIYLFAFIFDMKLLGLWVGFAVASGVCTCSYLAIITSIDWRKECEIALKRIKDDVDENR